MEPVQPKNPSKVIIVPRPPVSDGKPTQKSETVETEEVLTESDKKEEAKAEEPEQ